jgi:competence protein ComEC
VVSLVVTPLALVGAVLPFAGPLVLGHAILEALMAALDWLAGLPIAVWQQHSPPAWTLPLALAGVAWLLVPRGVPARGLGIVLLLPLLAAAPRGPRAGDLWITVLDVDRAFMLARTERHALRRRRPRVQRILGQWQPRRPSLPARRGYRGSTR